MNVHDEVQTKIKCRCGQQCSNAYNFRIHCVRAHNNIPQVNENVEIRASENFEMPQNPVNTRCNVFKSIFVAVHEFSNNKTGGLIFYLKQQR